MSTRRRSKHRQTPIQTCISTIDPDSHLADLLTKCVSLDTDDCAAVLETDLELEVRYNAVAMQGDTEPPVNAEDEMGFHYVCFAKSHVSGDLIILDGNATGPVDNGSFPGDDLFLDQGIEGIKEFIQQHDTKSERSGQFNLSALAASSDMAD
ncbi:hypothetical protein GGR57DRAFT_27733 [Xylariaceae sp. FL1272]|nr:hypothetical protein GGR57DRAFT_27733 [Xylariaceae sp. FL1272]